MALVRGSSVPDEMNHEQNPSAPLVTQALKMGEGEQFKAMMQSVEAAMLVAEIIQKRGTANTAFAASVAHSDLKAILRDLTAASVPPF